MRALRQMMRWAPAAAAAAGPAGPARTMLMARHGVPFLHATSSPPFQAGARRGYA
jgi:hypothetical protein